LSDYDGFELEESEGDEQLRFPGGKGLKIYNFPIYILRKILYLVITVNLWSVNRLSHSMGFEFEYSLEEKRHWAWLEDFTWPRPFLKAGVKKED